MEHGSPTDIAFCIVAAWLLGVVAQVLRQPALLAYIVAGYVIGPSGLRLVTNQESVESISAIGLILLLFVIGLEIDLRRVLSSGRAIVVTAVVQIVGTVVLGLLCFRGLGWPLGGGRFDALYLAAASFVSSTVIAVKILTDRRELDTLAGRIAIGVSVIQDIAVILFLGLQPALSNPSLALVGLTFVRIALLIGASLGISKFVLPTLFRRVATLPELVSVGALAWCFIIAAFAHSLGLSREMGALIAGLSISTFPYHLDVTAKVTSLRDFFITLFFVGLGLRIPAPEVGPLGSALVLSAFILVSRFLTVMVPLRVLGLGNRASFVSTLNLLPFSEFGLVLVGVGLAAGQIGPNLFAPVVYAFFILAVLGSYAIGRSDRLYLAVAPWLERLGLRDEGGAAPELGPSGTGPDIYLLGFSWTASSLLEEILRQAPQLVPRLVVVDFNPEVHRRLAQRGVRAIWGDVSQRDTLAHAGVGQARLILCTLPNIVLRGTNNVRLVQVVRSLNPTACIVAHAEALSDVEALESAGATHVHAPRLREADDLLGVVRAYDAGQLPDRLKEVQQRLENRNEVIP